MKYVYMLQSIADPDRHYVGSTCDLKTRFNAHNAGHSEHTRKYLPWELRGYVAFSEPAKADKFEAYLKTGSGRAFAKRHFQFPAEPEPASPHASLETSANSQSDRT